MTQQNVNDAVDRIVREHNGQPWEVEDPSNPDQCMDLIFGYLDILGIPRETVRHQFAVQAWKNPLDITLKYFEFIPNTPNGVPQKGDVPIFDGPIGHIMAALGIGDSGTFQSFDQNWDTANYHIKDPKTGVLIPICRIVTHDYKIALGWLRIRIQNVLTPPSPIIGVGTPIPPELLNTDEYPVKNPMEVQAIRSELQAYGRVKNSDSNNKLVLAKSKAQEIVNL